MVGSPNSFYLEKFLKEGDFFSFIWAARLFMTEWGEQ